MPSRNGIEDKKRRREGALRRLETRRGKTAADDKLAPEAKQRELARMDGEITVLVKRVGR